MEEEKQEKQQGTLAGGAYEAEDVFEGAEPWTSTETKLVVWSFVAAVISLILLGILVNVLILS
jgi:hypothetical protein